jgi:hypothetical protein
MLPFDCEGRRNAYSRNAAAFALHPRTVSRHRLSQGRFVRLGALDNCPGCLLFAVAADSRLERLPDFIEAHRVLSQEGVIDTIAVDQSRQRRAPSKNASAPGRAARCRSAISAVSVRRGSTTINFLSGSLLIRFISSCALGKP